MKRYAVFHLNGKKYAESDWYDDPDEAIENMNRHYPLTSKVMSREKTENGVELKFVVYHRDYDRG